MLIYTSNTRKNALHDLNLNCRSLCG